MAPDERAIKHRQNLTILNNSKLKLKEVKRIITEMVIFYILYLRKLSNSTKVMKTLKKNTIILK